MITQMTLLWLGTLALLTDYVALSQANDSKTQAVGLAFGLMFFAVFTINSTGYLTITDAGVTTVHESMALTVIGFVATATTLVLLLETGMRTLINR